MEETLEQMARSIGHVRQAGGDSRLKTRRHGSASLVESRLRSVHRRGNAIDGMADRAATGGPLSSPAPSAHRCTAAGLDSGAAVERLASMPFRRLACAARPRCRQANDAHRLTGPINIPRSPKPWRRSTRTGLSRQRIVRRRPDGITLFKIVQLAARDGN